MMVPVRTMCVSVGDLFGRGCTHFLHRQSQRQVLSSPRVVAVQNDLIALDLAHREHLLLTILCTTAQLAAHFHARWEILFGDGLHQRLVALTKSIGRGQLERGGKAHFLAFQRFFDFGKSVVEMCIRDRAQARSHPATAPAL